ncbi:right-handed parallel beta-helix repeat-containing protein [Methanobrevibacter sp.]|uniref:right-handed parallel beta-helix repeat-containing protein n=1 Tax=Methanobrevibacter sp. TaxID=66852 RepID=UPI003866023F
MKKKIIFLLVILVSICAMSHASAADAFDNVTDTQIIAESDIIDESTLNLEGDSDEVTILADANSITYINPGDDVQQKIDSANEGDKIVFNGSFSLENTITLNKKMDIDGINDATIKYGGPEYITKRCFVIDSSASSVTLSNLKITHWTCNDDGGVILWKGEGGTISNCEFDNNMNQGGSCGAIMISADNCKIINCTFKDNIVRKQSGGAVALEGNNCIVTNCTFNNNYASINGGAIVVNGKNNKICNSTFNGNYLKSSDNSSTSSGGAIYSNGESLKIDNCTFNDNHVYNGHGGAITLNKPNTIVNSSFNGNTALTGNDIYANEYSSILDSYFVIDENKTKSNAIYGVDQRILDMFNIFNVIKVNSKVTFSAGMIFTYGLSGSIYMTVNGGNVTRENIKVLNHPEAKITYSKNIVTVSNLAVGTYTLRVTTTPDEYHYSTDADLSITVKKATATIKASKVTVALKKSAKWTITVIDSGTKKGIANMKLTLKVYTGSKYKTAYATTNSKGVASYQTKGLSKGAHKIVVSAKSASYTFKTFTSSIKVVKQSPLKFKVTKATGKDGATVSITVKNKKTNKALNGVKVKVLIYTGKKYTVVTLKTKTIGKFKGICGYGTNKLSVGTHKVKVMPANIKYSGYAYSSMKITKSAKKIPGWETKDTAK